VQKVFIRELLFVDDDGLTAHRREAQQHLIDNFVEACFEFGPTISLKKPNSWVGTSAALPVSQLVTTLLRWLTS
jgi:hypothetical protein